MSKKDDLVKAIESRIKLEISEKGPLKFLLEAPLREYLDTVIATVYLYTRPKKGSDQHFGFTEIICAVGHAVRRALRQKTDSSSAAKAGAFFLWSFEAAGYVRFFMGQGKKGHGTYMIELVDDEGLSSLWSSVPNSKAGKLPQTEKPEPWKGFKHSSGAVLVKTGDVDVLKSLSPDKHPIIFDSINKSQEVGWKISREVLNVATWALKKKAEAFSDIWELQDPRAKETRLREARSIIDIAKRFEDTPFYHIYYYDFRGRKYPSSAYLHEQGSDFARGLLLREVGTSIEPRGFHWLLLYLANTWAGDAERVDGLKTDKISLRDRVQWAIDHEMDFLDYATAPKTNQGWMTADKPWQFLAACIELRKLREYQTTVGNFEDYSYMTTLVTYIDGSNNGCQHLAALTQDEITAVHVNLVPSDLPGDLYRYIGEHVWKHVNYQASELPPLMREAADIFIDKLIVLKAEINKTDFGSPERADKVEAIKLFKSEHQLVAENAAPVFWRRITDAKHRRKVVKRNTMTLPYGGTAYGLGEQQIKDARKHNIELLMHMEHRWGAYMGRVVFEDCKTSLQKPMQLLSVFENAGAQAESRGEFLKWTVPGTNFPVVQHYTEGSVKKTWVQYGPKTLKSSTGHDIRELQLNVCFVENQVPSKGKQSQGASPNIIHSLDAAHLAMTVSACSFPVTTIHDSFGALPPHMDELFRVVREQFVELYKLNPLESICRDIGADTSNVSFGSLNISSIINSDFAFI